MYIVFFVFLQQAFQEVQAIWQPLKLQTCFNGIPAIVTRSCCRTPTEYHATLHKTKDICNMLSCLDMPHKHGIVG